MHFEENQGLIEKELAYRKFEDIVKDQTHTNPLDPKVLWLFVSLVVCLLVHLSKGRKVNAKQVNDLGRPVELLFSKTIYVKNTWTVTRVSLWGEARRIYYRLGKR